MKLVTSPQNDAVKFVRSLSNKRHRQEAGLFVAEGEKVLARARAKGWKPGYLFTRDGAAEEWAEETVLASESVMRAVSGQENASTMVALFRERWAVAPASPQGLWLLLDAIRDPGNLGTIIRTADAAGASGIILTGQYCDPWSAETVRATMGSIFAMPLVRLDIGAAAALCRSWPGEIVATEMAGGEDFRRSYRAPTLLMLGSEGTGLSPARTALAHVSVRIPMAEGPESLNVASAAAVMMYRILHG